MLTPGDQTQRLRVVIRGAVQGVGFRPFVYRLAQVLGLPGWVNNTSQGVFIEVEGDAARLREFLLRLPREAPPRASIQSLESTFLDPAGYANFEIRASTEGDGAEGSGGVKSTLVLPDIATCADCLREVLNPVDRRYRYPFTNCTNCGPRYSIIEGLPYDRPLTTMRGFVMCERCRAEYENPADRRFHAQPNACPVCGPRLELWDPAGRALATHDEALLRAAEAIRQGRIVAIKGLGGFHLVVDARDDEAIKRLRERKRREAKPLAVMAPTLENIKEYCEVGDLEVRLLQAPEAPIVLLWRKVNNKSQTDVISDYDYDYEHEHEHEYENSIRNLQSAICNSLIPHSAFRIPQSLAPGNPYLGVMLPYTPLHHLLLAELGFPIVATSGNVTDEPICIDEHEALGRLAGMADLFLVHNRPIARHVDDSVVRVMLGRELVMRRARGYAPLPITLREPLPPVLAVGAHLKNTIAIGVERQVFISQHIGDLETKGAHEAFERVIGSLGGLYDFKPERVACDAHPDYLSTRHAEALAQTLDLPLIAVQHHVAHVLACMGENEIHGPVLGVSWDGTGYGLDGTVWGGEFFIINANNNWTRIGHLRTFPLPGGEAAVREPRRTALGLLYEYFGERLFEHAREPAETPLARALAAFTPAELKVLRQMLARGLNCPRTSSAGRLFDGVAALLGLRPVTLFEGQTAMELEFATVGETTNEAYPFTLREPEIVAATGRQPWVIDWTPMLEPLINDIHVGFSVGKIAAKFHNMLVESIVAIARRGEVPRVALSGGCFQNRYLLEHTITRLRAAGFQPYWHQRIPTNDGGIALGQVLAAAREAPKGAT